MRLNTFIILFLFVAFGYAEDTVIVRDPHSYARPEEAVVRHLDLDLTIDFDKREIHGMAGLDVENRKKVNELWLDTRGLNIERVTLGDKETPAKFRMGETAEILGTPLVIEIPPDAKRVNVYYRTKPDAEGLQWLTAEQTAGKKHPFLFTQGQAILTRTWIPLQDTPGVRFTYSARVHVPPPLVALMSAEHVGGEATEKIKASKRPARIKIRNDFEFRMPHPIPSYLLALAAGDIEFRKIGDRCGIYAEPPVVDKARFEFAETEKMLAAAEKLYGPYRWGRYDIIVLPPSFPFGGMENPCLTFATPTIIAGDRSLVSLVAHELAHSWSGNLVTNATWSDFWLNEGFTVYSEHRIMEELYGKDYSDMLDELSFADLERYLARAGNDAPESALKSRREDKNPDESVPYYIAYDKGRIFLKTMETALGRKTWDAFVREYFDHFAFRSISSEMFVAFLRERVVKGDPRLEKELMLDAWVFGPGLPSNAAKPHSVLFEKVDAEVKAWTEGKAATDLNTAGWSTQEWQRFLNKLPSTLNAGQMTDLDSAFSFSASGNSEILFLWLTRVVDNRYEAGYPALKKFLMSIGRLKFVMPLYVRLSRTEEGKKMAKEIFESARPAYHPLTVNSVDSLLRK